MKVWFKIIIAVMGLAFLSSAEQPTQGIGISDGVFYRTKVQSDLWVEGKIGAYLQKKSVFTFTGTLFQMFSIDEKFAIGPAAFAGFRLDSDENRNNVLQIGAGLKPQFKLSDHVYLEAMVGGAMDIEFGNSSTYRMYFLNNSLSSVGIVCLF